MTALWKIKELHDGWRIIDYHVADQVKACGISTRELALTFAAAPELLRQCQEAKDFLTASHQNPTNGEWNDYGAMILHDALCLAIARATGAPPP